MRNTILVLILLVLCSVLLTSANVTVAYECGEDCTAGQGTTTTWTITTTDDMKSAGGLRFELTLPVNATLPNDCYLTPETPRLTNYMGSPVYTPITSGGTFKTTVYHIDYSLGDFPWRDDKVILECNMGLSTLAKQSGGAKDFIVKSLSDGQQFVKKSVTYPELKTPPVFKGSMSFSASAGNPGQVVMDLSLIPYKITEYDMIIIKHHKNIPFSGTTNCSTSGGANMELATEPNGTEIRLITPMDIAQGEGMLYLRCSIRNTPLSSDLTGAPEDGYEIIISTTKFYMDNTSKGDTRYTGKLVLSPPEDAIIGGTTDNAQFGFHPNYAGAQRYWMVFETNNMNSPIPVDTIHSGGDQMVTENKPGRVMMTISADAFSPTGELSDITCVFNIGNNNPLRPNYSGETTVKKTTIGTQDAYEIKWVPETNLPASSFANRMARFFCSNVKPTTTDGLPIGDVIGHIGVYNYRNNKLAGNSHVQLAPFHTTKPATPILLQTFRFNTTTFFNNDKLGLLTQECSQRLKIDQRFISISRQTRVQGTATAGVEDGDILASPIIGGDVHLPLTAARKAMQVQQEQPAQPRTYLHVVVVINETPELTLTELQRTFQSQVTLIANKVAQSLRLTTDVQQPTSERSTFPTTCSNGIRDEGESDIDCGGTSQCFGCQVGRACTVDNDCATGQCVDRKCYSGNSASTSVAGIGILAITLLATVLSLW